MYSVIPRVTIFLTYMFMQIQETLGGDMNAKAVVACFLIQEGASLELRNVLGHTPLESCTDPVIATVISTFAEGNAGLFCADMVVV